MTIILGRLGCMQCTGQEGRTPHAPHAGRSNAPKYTARHSSALHWQAVGCLSTWNIFRTSIFHALFCICVCTILVLYLYGMCWGSSVGAIKICHLIMALPGPAESQQWGLDWTRWWCAQCGNKLRINKPPLANNTFSWSWQVHAVPQYMHTHQITSPIFPRLSPLLGLSWTLQIIKKYNVTIIILIAQVHIRICSKSLNDNEIYLLETVHCATWEAEAKNCGKVNDAKSCLIRLPE